MYHTYSLLNTALYMKINTVWLWCSTGVKRETEEEIKAGQVDVKTSESPYTTQNMTYSKEEYESLVSLTSYNIMNNKQSIIETLKKAMEKKASQIKK